MNLNIELISELLLHFISKTSITGIDDSRQYTWVQHLYKRKIVNSTTLTDKSCNFNSIRLYNKLSPQFKVVKECNFKDLLVDHAVYSIRVLWGWFEYLYNTN